MATEAHIRAVRKYEANNFEKLQVRMPIGTKDRINAAGYTINAFIIEAMNEKFARMEK